MAKFNNSGRGMPKSLNQEGPRPSRPVTIQPSCLDKKGIAMLNDGISTIVETCKAVQVPTGFFESDIDIKARISDSIIRYIKEIELWNPRLGLVEVAGHDLIDKHILDSLAPLPLLVAELAKRSIGNNALHMADIGSGAGLPGIPLVIAINALIPRSSLVFDMTLVEKQQRRVGFLLNAKAMLKLDNLFIIQENLEVLVASAASGKQVTDAVTILYDIVSARAFRPLEPIILSQLKAIESQDGTLFLYKGRMERIQEEIAACNLNNVPGVKIVPICVPGLVDERHIVLI